MTLPGPSAPAPINFIHAVLRSFSPGSKLTQMQHSLLQTTQTTDNCVPIHQSCSKFLFRWKNEQSWQIDEYHTVNNASVCVSIFMRAATVYNFQSERVGWLSLILGIACIPEELKGTTKSKL